LPIIIIFYSEGAKVPRKGKYNIRGKAQKKAYLPGANMPLIFPYPKYFFGNLCLLINQIILTII